MSNATEYTTGKVPNGRIDSLDFTKYDIHAVKQINRNIDLIKYKNYKNELLILEMVHTNIFSEDKPSVDFILSLGDDVQEKKLKHYFGF